MRHNSLIFLLRHGAQVIESAGGIGGFLESPSPKDCDLRLEILGIARYVGPVECCLMLLNIGLAKLKVKLQSN